MPKYQQILNMFLFSLFVCSSAHATLSQYSTQIVVDDQGTSALTDDLFFYRDLSRFSDMTYMEQVTETDLLNTELSGSGPWLDNWHLATSAEMANLFADFISVPDVFLPSYGTDSYVGRYGQTGAPSEHMVYEVIESSGFPPITHEKYDKLDSSSYPLLGAWAVATYNPRQVPEPMPLILLGMGILALAAAKKYGSKTQITH